MIPNLLKRTTAADLEALCDSWRQRWPDALALWSKFTRLGEPHWCFDDDEAKRQGLTGSFAMIRLNDQAVVISLPLIDKFKLQSYPLEILAHEIGHHVFCPADLTDNARMIARMRWALPTKEHLANLVGNLYTDLLINDRLQRAANLRISNVYSELGGGSSSRLWTLYMRVYEILWSIEKGRLASGSIDAQLEGDAHLGARLVRSYAKDWLDGSGRFAALCLPYLLTDDGSEMQKLLRGWRDTANAGADALPDGLTEIEEGEREGAIHPSLDDELSELGEEDEKAEQEAKPKETSAQSVSDRQYRDPFQYGQLLKNLGLDLSDHEIAVRYYRERALPYLVRFPTRIVSHISDPLPEGLMPWDISSPLENLDWPASVLNSPTIIPGMTTLERVWGTTEGAQPERHPIYLDLYVDCSGSMPNPQVHVSYLALAGAIVALSALRAGARVQATLWSGAAQFETTGDFVSDEQAVLRILTGYLGGATAFPIHILRETYRNRPPSARPVHILVISDNGITTMFDQDELGNSGWDISRMALENARGGGTLVLNLFGGWENRYPALMRARADGWQVCPVSTWAELVAFAREFSARKFGEKQ